MAFDLSRIATDPEARNAFLAALYATGSVIGAVQSTGYSRASVYRQRRRDPVFAARWDATVGSPTASALEAAMVTRATFGVERRRRYADNSEEVWRVFDEAMAWKLLQKLNPGRYDPVAAAAMSPRRAMTRATALARLAALGPLPAPQSGGADDAGGNDGGGGGDAAGSA